MRSEAVKDRARIRVRPWRGEESSGAHPRSTNFRCSRKVTTCGSQGETPTCCAAFESVACSWFRPTLQFQRDITSAPPSQTLKEGRDAPLHAVPVVRRLPQRARRVVRVLHRQDAQGDERPLLLRQVVRRPLVLHQTLHARVDAGLEPLLVRLVALLVRGADAERARARVARVRGGGEGRERAVERHEERGVLLRDDTEARERQGLPDAAQSHPISI